MSKLIPKCQNNGKNLFGNLLVQPEVRESTYIAKPKIDNSKKARLLPFGTLRYHLADRSPRDSNGYFYLEAILRNYTSPDVRVMAQYNPEKGDTVFRQFMPDGSLKDTPEARSIFRNAVKESKR